MEPGGSMPHSQGLSNNPYKPWSYLYYFSIEWKYYMLHLLVA